VKGTDRSEKIRTYNFPDGRVTDHRIPLTLNSLESILQGGEALDRFSEALEEMDSEEKLEEILSRYEDGNS